MQSDLEKIKEAGLQVVGISYDSPEVIKKFANSHSIAFPLLSDPESRTINAYHIRNTDADDGQIKGVPHPGTFVVDDKGIVRAKLGREGYKERHSSMDLINAAKALDASK